MKSRVRSLFSYALSMAVALALLLWIMRLGSQIYPGQPLVPSEQVNWMGDFANSPMVGVLIRILIILILSWLCSWAMRFWGQPRVVGEMVAGILLGKSVFAWIWPSGFAAIFPDSALGQLYLLSQFGLICFMFVVGLDLRLSHLKNRASAALLISHVSIVVPFILGAALALGLFASYGLANTSFISFALFMGIAMSITAFPVLARILQERQLAQTPVGTMALTCAAIDDVTAWCLLAAVIGFVRAGSFAHAFGVGLAASCYIFLMLKFVRPLLVRILRPVTVDGNFESQQFAVVFCVVLGSGFLAEIIGIHTLFGAFLAGIVMPYSESFRGSLIEKIESLSTVVLMPVFFAFTGLRTQIGMLDSIKDWTVCAVILFLAIVGKMAGSAFAARGHGMRWNEAGALGALMNTRGLMELVVLNVGLDLGILSPKIFTMMVIMAIVTTVMTGPLLSLLLRQGARTSVAWSD